MTTGEITGPGERACPRCARINGLDVRFCARCGLELSQYEGSPQVDPEAVPCYRHSNQLTLVRCGRCEKPICPKCARLGPAGARCPECAKHTVSLRPAGILYRIRRSVSGLFSGLPIWAQVSVGFFLVSTLLSVFQGCLRPAPRVPVERGADQPADLTMPGD